MLQEKTKKSNVGKSKLAKQTNYRDVVSPGKGSANKIESIDKEKKKISTVNQTKNVILIWLKQTWKSTAIVKKISIGAKLKLYKP